MKNHSHIIRFSVILTTLVIGFFAVKTFVAPESFGTYETYIYGYHRGYSDSEAESLPILFQGAVKCGKCHEEQYEQKSQANHAKVACEACHGHWQAHNNNNKDQVQKKGTIEACMLCHKQLIARTESFPQITEIKQHVDEQEEEFEKGMGCLDCHDPHEPGENGSQLIH